MEEGMTFAPDAGLNTSVGNESKEVSQEDMVRVSENAKKAALIGGQIRDDSQKNAQVADFLEFLFDAVANDHLRKIVLTLCTRPDSTGKNTTISIYEMVAFFVPHYEEHAQQCGVFDAIPDLPRWSNTQLDGYCEYVAMLRHQYPFVTHMHLQTLASLVAEILAYHHQIPSLNDLQPENKTELIQQIMLMIQ